MISKKGKRDGEDISVLKDEKGNLFIQEMVKKAFALKPGEIGEHTYPWINPGETETKTKVARFMYFAPWDWVIGVGTTQDEFLDTATKIETSAMHSSLILLAMLILSLAAALVVWIVTAKRITLTRIQSRKSGSKNDQTIWGNSAFIRFSQRFMASIIAV